jgi:hypothetical protein
MKKSDDKKSLSLLAFERCALETPSSMPILASREKMDGYCVSMIMDKSIPAVYGGGFDLKFATKELAYQWVDTVNTLISHAVAAQL